jgi:uncharacterized protein (TIGR03118 family)
LTIHSFNNAISMSGGILSASLLALVYGCSSSSSSATGTDASTDTGSSTEEDASVGTDGSSAAETSTVSDARAPLETGATDASDAAAVPFEVVTQANLISDTEGGAPFVDPKLTVAWGLAFPGSAAGATAWISETGTNLLSVYSGKTTPPYSTESFAVAVPTNDAGAAPGPTGQIFNPDSTAEDGAVGAFDGDLFLASDANGTVAAWQKADGTTTATATAVIRINESGSGAVFTGLAILPTTPPELAVADLHNNSIWLYDETYTSITAAAGTWTDPSIPTGYAPYNIVVSGSNVYVAYAKKPTGGGPIAAVGAGNGAVSVFTPSGTLVKSLIPAGGALNAPWGLAVVPAGGWGALTAGTLLVGNFGSGWVGAFDPTAGTLLDWLGTSSTQALTIGGLWALEFLSSTTDAGTSSVLYFTAGGDPSGVFGYLTPAP